MQEVGLVRQHDQPTALWVVWAVGCALTREVRWRCRGESEADIRMHDVIFQQCIHHVQSTRMHVARDVCTALH
eukprot:scaffold127715_cov75-Phaeocystis_antarctica.AAC.1